MKKLVGVAAIAAGVAFGAPAIAQTKPTVPVIVKNMTSPYWQAVLAGARKAGQDLGANVVELGAQSEFDVSGQISILEQAVASNPAAIVIAPTQFAALGKPIDEAAKKVKIIGLEFGGRYQRHDLAFGDRQCECGSHRRRRSRSSDHQVLC